MARPAFKTQRNKRPARPRAAKHSSSKDHAAPPAAPSPAANEPMMPRPSYTGDRLSEDAGLLLRAHPSKDYALVDSGNGRKLERYGPLLLERPEAQAIWQPTLTPVDWAKADAVFTGDTDEEGQGRWRYPQLGDGEQLDEVWPMAFDGMVHHGRFTSFRHTGVFPEQAAHWLHLQDIIRAASRSRSDVRMLNLFGYTGIASLVAARAGAHVTHVDASKRAIGWARENQGVAGLEDAPIRWICDDAMKFCAREVRRGNRYDVILLDPPAYGRGPKGEVWHLFDHLPHMMDLIAQLQSDRPLVTVLTAYAIRASHLSIHELMQEVMSGREGHIASGELVLEQENGNRLLSTSMFSRFTGKAALP